MKWIRSENAIEETVSISVRSWNHDNVLSFVEEMVMVDKNGDVQVLGMRQSVLVLFQKVLSVRSKVHVQRYLVMKILL